MISSTTTLAEAVGTAKPRPSMVSHSDIIFMLVIPTTRPYWSMRAPPELPELMAALVWSRVMVRPSTSMSRSMAEMMPLVSVPRSCRGEPMA